MVASVAKANVEGDVATKNFMVSRGGLVGLLLSARWLVLLEFQVCERMRDCWDRVLGRVSVQPRVVGFLILGSKETTQDLLRISYSLLAPLLVPA